MEEKVLEAEKGLAETEKESSLMKNRETKKCQDERRNTSWGKRPKRKKTGKTTDRINGREL